MIYRCPTHKTVTLFIRDNSFFLNSHLKFEEFVLLVYLWAHRTPISISMSKMGLSSKTVVDWFNLFREICSKYLIQNRQQIGGPGAVVEIDERIVGKRNYNVGHYVPEKWVFGGIDLSTGIGFLSVVDDRSVNSLLPLIEQYIAPETVIHSDMWRASHSTFHSQNR